MEVSANKSSKFEDQIWLSDHGSRVTYRKLRLEDLGREYFGLLAQLTESPYPPDLRESEQEAELALELIK